MKQVLCLVRAVHGYDINGEAEVGVSSNTLHKHVMLIVSMLANNGVHEIEFASRKLVNTKDAGR